MRQIKRFSFLLAVFFAAASFPAGLSAQTITVSKGIPFSPEALSREITEAGGAPEGAEILLYGYTSVTERYTLLPDETLSVKSEEAELLALVKIMKKGTLVRAEFVSGRGMDEKTLLSSLAASIAGLRTK